MQQSLQDLGAIGNCQYLALVDAWGRVNWLCWPRFDSPFIFGSLIDDDKGGTFQINAAQPVRGRIAYLTNTNILKHTFETAEGAFEVIDFAPRYQFHDAFTKPTQLFRIVRPIRGEPLVKVICDPRPKSGKVRCEKVLGPQYIRFDGAEQELRLTTNAPLSYVQNEQPFPLKQTLYFALTYGETLSGSVEAAVEDALRRTTSYWQKWVKHCALPTRYQEEVIRSALVLKLHQYEDTGAVIAATTTSIPEAADSGRNWDYRYCWIRDGFFTVNALLKLSQFEEMEGFERFIQQVSSHHNWPLQPVFAIDASKDLTETIAEDLTGYRNMGPVRFGNDAYNQLQHDVYGEIILALAPLYLDIRFQVGDQSQLYLLLDRLVASIEEHWQSTDSGIWEFRGQTHVFTFSLLIHWAGANAAYEIAQRAKLLSFAERAASLRDKIATHMREVVFDKERDFYPIAAGVPELDASLLMLVNLGFLDAKDPKTLAYVHKIAEGLVLKKGLIRRYRHYDGLGDTHNAFTICSFWLVEALCRCGEREEAEAILKQLCLHANELGLWSEDIEPESGELWGNFPQTYSHVGLINAAFLLYPPWH